MKRLTLSDIEWEVICHDEEIPVEGNAIASGDDDYDREVEDKILKDLTWNPWAWCTVQVRGTWNEIEKSACLGGCSYSGEKEFCQPGGYFDDMRNEILRLIQEKAEDIAEKITEIPSDS